MMQMMAEPPLPAAVAAVATVTVAAAAGKGSTVAARRSTVNAMPRGCQQPSRVMALVRRHGMGRRRRPRATAWYGHAQALTTHGEPW